MRMRIPLATALLALVLAAGWASPAIPASPLRAQADGQLDVVKASYDNLMDLFYRPIEPSALLGAGWHGLGRAASTAGLPQPPPLGTLPSGRNEAFTAFSSSYNAYLASLPSDTLGQNLGFAVARSMASSLNDDHTNFLSPSGYNAFLGSLGGGELPVGLGIQTTGAAPWLVTGTAPGGPAATARIQPGDELVATDGVDLSAASPQEFNRALGGPVGTSHSVTVQRGPARVMLSVTRGTYYFPPLSSRMLDAQTGYLAIQHFAVAGLTLPDGTELLSDLDRRLSDLDTQGAQGLVLDLRGNSGGDTTAAEEILGRFLPASAETDVRFDERGHEATGIVAGPMHRVQLPMVVLVDGGSASSSELVASTLKESGRAILAGERTAGALATSEILPLPQSAGLQIDVAEQVTARTGYQIDGVGFPVDIEVPDTRTAENYRAGSDPQLQAAVAALAQAPVPPAAEALSAISKQRIGALLSPYMPSAAQMPTNNRLTSSVKTESLDLNEPNEWLDSFGFGGRNPYEGQATLQRRGWLGSHVQNYNLAPLVPPGISVVIDMYAAAAGANDALITNDFPDQQVLFPSPVDLGDGAIAARGIWLNLGSVALSWRRGNVVLNVGYGDVPGYENMDTVVAAARVLDQIYQQNPLPNDLVGALTSEHPGGPAAFAVKPLEGGDGATQIRPKGIGHQRRPQLLEASAGLISAPPLLCEEGRNMIARSGLLLEVLNQSDQDLRIVKRAKRVLGPTELANQPAGISAQDVLVRLDRVA